MPRTWLLGKQRIHNAAIAIHVWPSHAWHAPDTGSPVQRRPSQVIDPCDPHHPPYAITSLAAVFFVTSKSAALTDGLVTQFGVGIWILTAYMAAAGVARRDRGAVLLGQGGGASLHCHAQA